MPGAFCKDSTVSQVSVCFVLVFLLLYALSASVAFVFVMRSRIICIPRLSYILLDLS